MLRAIREIRPRWVVGENVLGIVNWNRGMVFEQVHVDLETEGYEVQAFVLPACSVGAPHRRDRTWFVAHAVKTPGAMDARAENLKKKEQRFGNSGTLAQELQTGFIYKRGLLPTVQTQGLNENGKTVFMPLGLLPSPTSTDWNTALSPEQAEKYRAKYPKAQALTQLRQMAVEGLLPTPMASGDICHPERIRRLKSAGGQTMGSRKCGKSRPNGIMDYLMFQGILLMPTMLDKENPTLTSRKRGNEPIMEQSAKSSKCGRSSQLNPLFVQEMMGFPYLWTELPFQSGEQKQSTPTETR